VITSGEAESNTGVPVEIGGLTGKRVLWAPTAGVFTSDSSIGDTVFSGQIVGTLGDIPLCAPLDGMLRGLIRSGVTVPKGAKLAEVDPINDRSICNLITDKARTVGEGVLKAIALRYS
jgi:xanthine dehydrogenase accessory factor